MKFGPVPVASAAGTITAHTLRLPQATIRKGTRLTAHDATALAEAGFSLVIVATTEADDLHEDETAERLARAAAGPHVTCRAPTTGRSNLYADVAGLLVVDAALVDRINAVDPAITFATLEAFAPVAADEMVATIKIIPFAAPRTAVEAAEQLCAASKPIHIAPYIRRTVGVVATMLPSLKPGVMDKTRRALDERLWPTGAAVSAEIRVDHETAATARAIDELRRAHSDVVVVFGASAVSDRADVIPAAIERAGGRVLRVGMPVDPGNLLVLGEIDGTPVIGAPGCARSPRENGFDWVLHRLLAGLQVTDADISRMGVGGLLKEIPTRAAPREAAPAPD